MISGVYFKTHATFQKCCPSGAPLRHLNRGQLVSVEESLLLFVRQSNRPDFVMHLLFKCSS